MPVRTIHITHCSDQKFVSRPPVAAAKVKCFGHKTTCNKKSIRASMCMNCICNDQMLDVQKKVQTTEKTFFKFKLIIFLKLLHVDFCFKVPVI